MYKYKTSVKLESPNSFHNCAAIVKSVQYLLTIDMTCDLSYKTYMKAAFIFPKHMGLEHICLT